MITYGPFEIRDVHEHLGTETLDQTSLSVPDMSLSVKDILTRFRRGTLDPSDLYRPSLDLEQDIDDDSLDDLDDLTDFQNLALRTNGKIDQISRDILDRTGTPAPSGEESSGAKDGPGSAE